MLVLHRQYIIYSSAERHKGICLGTALYRVRMKRYGTRYQGNKKKNKKIKILNPVMHAWKVVGCMLLVRKVLKECRANAGIRVSGIGTSS